MKKKAPKISRTQAREMEKKFSPAIKQLSKHMYGTSGEVTSDLVGYKVPAGTFRDKFNREWQVQAHVVLSKSHVIKKDEVVPIVRRWAIAVRVKAFLSYIIDWAHR